MTPVNHNARPWWYLVLLLGLMACQPTPGEESAGDGANTTATQATTPDAILGNYVTESYAQRAEGYDWVAVSIHPTLQNALQVSIRSRADQKKPTCTYDGRIYQVAADTYNTFISGEEIRFVITEDQLTIAPVDEAGASVLAYYCSGGGTLAGTYRKIEGDLDQTQIDPTQFSKVLELQDVRFQVTSIPQDTGVQLTVLATGLENPPDPFILKIAGRVTEAEVEDMNADGSPELMVYTRTGNGYGSVQGFSVNNGKSLSMVNFPSTRNNEAINEGYQGQDIFALVENKLVQRFPVHNAAGEPTGVTREVVYDLQEGEAMRQLKVLAVNEYK